MTTNHDCAGAFCPACPTCRRCGFRVLVHDGEMDCDAQDVAVAALTGGSASEPDSAPAAKGDEGEPS